MKKFLGLLFILAIFSAASISMSSDSQSWVLVHKVEFCLLVCALIVVCLIHPAQTGQVPSEFRTLRFEYYSGGVTRFNTWGNYRSHCDCGSYLKATGRVAQVLLYTRNGTQSAQHAEYR